MLPATVPVEPDPSLVTPGRLGLLITVLLAVAVWLLIRSMLKQFKKVDFPEDPEAPEAETDTSSDARPAAE